MKKKTDITNVKEKILIKNPFLLAEFIKLLLLAIVEMLKIGTEIVLLNKIQLGLYTETIT